MQKAMTEAEVLRLSGEADFTLYPADQLAAAGFSLSDEPYDASTTVLARLPGLSFLPTVQSLTTAQKTNLTYERPSEMSEPIPVYTYSTYTVPAVQVYMGFLLLDDGMNTTLYTSDGNLLCTYKSGTYTPANTRAADGTPLFWEYLPGDGKRYCTPGENGEFGTVEYEDSIDGRGVYFDYPAYYGVSDNDLRRLVQRTRTVGTDENGLPMDYEEQRWAYGYTAGWRRTGYNFTKAYDYSEGMAAILDDDGYLNYLKENGYYAFYPKKNYYYYERYVTEYLLPPITSGEESIGFYYYDHGLVRVRRQVVDWYGITYINTLRVAVDEDILIDKTGKEFPVPEGYDIIAYSDGVILLERNGKYGYMDYTGAWIAQPIYDYARPFIEGVAVAGFSDGTRLMLDTAGEIVIPAGIYTHISDASSGVIAVWREVDGWDVVYKMGKFE